MPKAEVNNEETLVITFHFGTRSSQRFLRGRWWPNDVFAANRQGCSISNASLSGGYSFADSGETLGPASIKFAEVGVITFDGAGGFKGNATMNDGGTICTATVTGTYSINPDGSGSATVTQTPDAVSTASGCTLLVFKDNSISAATDYWLENAQLHYKNFSGDESAVPLEQVDLEVTAYLNWQRGVKFVLRPKPVAG